LKSDAYKQLFKVLKMFLSVAYRIKALEATKTSSKRPSQTLDSKLFKQIRQQSSERFEEKYHVFPMISISDYPEEEHLNVLKEINIRSLKNNDLSVYSTTRKTYPYRKRSRQIYR